MRLVVAPRARKDLKRLDPKTQERLLNKLKFFAAHKQALRFADTLTNAEIGTHRFRVGEYRIICEREADTLYVLRIGHRREIYR